MKHLRTIMPLLLSFTLGVGTMTPAFAADANPSAANEGSTGQTNNQTAANGDRTVDAKISVTGFEKGDTVTAYKFIKWVDSVGWQLADGITGITLKDITNANELDAEKLAILASADNIGKMTPVTDGHTLDSGTAWEMECGTDDTAGSYLILIKSGTVNAVYNPAVVSADFDGTNDAAVDLTEENAMIKKQPISLVKEVDDPSDNAVQAGEIIPFTVSVTVPQYNDNWTNPSFVVTDELTSGLTISASPTIEGLTAGEDYILTNGTEGASGFTITFSEDYLKNNPSKEVEIKYSAVVGDDVIANAQVHEETNTVTLDFSNNPQNQSDHDTIDDETHHYTFAIDGTRLGQGSTKTNELIKVGITDDGDPITLYKEGATLPEQAKPLAGAQFTLTGTGANGQGKYEQTVESDSEGRVFFNNLDTGTYTLKETKAPSGYMKDPNEYTVKITAEFDKANNNTLTSYKITINDEATSSYTATTNANEVTYVTPDGGNESFPINNIPGTELPSTGGIGTTIFYIVGGGMVVSAVVYLLTKRRMAGNE